MPSACVAELIPNNSYAALCLSLLLTFWPITGVPMLSIRIIPQHKKVVVVVIGSSFFCFKLNSLINNCMPDRRMLYPCCLLCLLSPWAAGPAC